MRSGRRSTDRSPSLVVVIAALADGGSRLDSVLHALPADAGFAYVVVLADGVSMPNDVPLPVVDADHGPCHLVADRVHLVRAEQCPTIVGYRLEVARPGPGAHEGVDAVAELVVSLGRWWRERAAVVFCGRPGASTRPAIADLRSAGGLSIDVEAGVGRSAVVERDARRPELTLAPNALALALHAFALDPTDIRGSEAAELGHLGRVSVGLAERFAIDLAHYKPSVVVRQLHQRVARSDAVDLADYADRLVVDDHEQLALYRAMFGGPTYFFRDLEFWERFAETTLPALVDRAIESGELRCWVAGCATGEEAYTLAITIVEELERRDLDLDVRIHATDIETGAVATAASGLYPESVLEFVSEARRKRFFNREADGFRIAPALRRVVACSRHDVLREAAFSDLDLISCRNVLTLLTPAAQNDVLRLLHYSLRVGGVLLVGMSEGVGDLASEFSSLEAPRSFAKRRDVHLVIDPERRLVAIGPSAPPTPARVGGDDPLAAVYDELLDSFAPTGFLIDADRRLLHTFGRAGEVIRQGRGRTRLDILQLVEPSIRVPMWGAIQRAVTTGESVRLDGLPAHPDDPALELSMVLRPLRDHDDRVGHLFIGVVPIDEADRIGDAGAVPFAAVASTVGLRRPGRDVERQIDQLEQAREAAERRLATSIERLANAREALLTANRELRDADEAMAELMANRTAAAQTTTAVLRALGVGMVLVDRDLVVRHTAGDIAESVGLGVATVGRPVPAIGGWASPSLPADLRTVMATGESIERPIVGGPTPLTVTIAPFRREDGVVGGAVLSLLDIRGTLTRQRRSDREAELSLLVDLVPAALWVIDHDRRILRMNSAAARLPALIEGDLIGRSVFRCYRDHLVEVFGDPERSLGELEQDGAEADLVVTSEGGGAYRVDRAALRDGSGEVEALVVVLTDLTEAVETQQELRMKNEVLEHRNNELDQFAHMASHDLRAPLRAIYTFTQMGMETAGEVQQELLGNVLASVDRMRSVLDSLLAYTGTDKDPMFGIVSLHDVVASALNDLACDMSDTGAVVEVGPLPIVRCDATLMRRLFQNLVANAIAYRGDAPPHIVIDSRVEFGFVEVRVVDHGIGFPSDRADEVFKPFKRLSVASPGQGIGLAICRRIVERHHGTIRAESSVGGPTTLVIRLPRNGRA